MRFQRGTAVFATVAIVSLAACSGPVEPEPAPPREGIITFAPSITETVFALGEGHRVVGVTNFCAYPPEATELPRVGDVINPNLEKITALRPAMIILPGPSSTAKVAQLAERLGIQTVNGYMDNLTSIRDGIIRIGEALDAASAAEELVASMDAAFASISSAVEGRDRPKVLLVPTRDSHRLDTIFSVGTSSFMSELLEIAGGRNILADHEEPYIEASKETLVVREPDVIIEIHAGVPLSDEEREDYRNDWEALSALPAVQNDRIYVLSEDYLLIPGPRAPKIARRFAECLHPDIEWNSP